MICSFLPSGYVLGLYVYVDAIVCYENLPMMWGTEK